jgi:hypothetical protein
MPSQKDFNLSPYFDDYAESKKFHRVLFRPSFAVQARELTQSQTILQNQVEKLSDHLFEKGAMIIPGEISFDLEYYAVKITNKTFATVAEYIGKEITGVTSGVKGICINAVANNGTDPDTLYVKYNKTGTNNTTSVFTNDETIQARTIGTDGITIITVNATAVVTSTATGSAANVAAGVYYINGFHVSVSEQTLILDKYTNTPSYRVGLTVVESFVSSNEDTSLVDNAQGSSNLNAPGADRFKIDLILAKKTISSVDDVDFVELLRLSNGIRQNQVRSTEYAVLEDTFARRTYDESGDYTVREFDLDMREHLIEGNNRGVFSLEEGGDDTLLVAGLSPGKAYVKGYEVETIGTTLINIEKARDFATDNNSRTRFDIENFINVTKTFNTPDIGNFVGETEAYREVLLFDTPTQVRGTTQSTLGLTVPQIGRAKTRGFELNTGSATSNVLSSSALTSAVFKHYLFDTEMFTHLNLQTAPVFIDGEKVRGVTSGATGFVQSISARRSSAVGVITVANPGVVTVAGGAFKEGQQITLQGGTWQIGGVSAATAAVYTVRNVGPTSLAATGLTSGQNGTYYKITFAGTTDFTLIGAPNNNIGTVFVKSGASGLGTGTAINIDQFQLFLADGVTPANVTSYSSSPNVFHTVLVLNNVTGTFLPGETVTGITSNVNSVIQSDRLGFKGVKTFNTSEVKSVSNGTVIAGSIVFTADASIDSTYGETYPIFGSISVANSGTTVTGFGTLFNTELVIGDSITFTTDAGTSVTRNVESISSNTILKLSIPVGGSDVSTKTVAFRNRAKVQGPEKNILIFELPFSSLNTLKTTSNNNLSDTNFSIRRTIVSTLDSSGSVTLVSNTNETFSSDQQDYVVSVISTTSGVSVQGNILSLSGNNHLGAAIFTRNGTGTNLTINLGTNYASAKLKILVTVNKNVANSKTKTRVTETLAISSQSQIQSKVISLQKADVVVINSIYMSSNFSTPASATTSPNNIDVTDRYTLDNGQRDNFYDVGRIKLKTGAIEPTGLLLVNFDYFQHGNGDFFDIDSYDSLNDYVSIPDYTSDTTGKTYALRDCLDFRPRVADASTIFSEKSDRFFQTSISSLATGASFINVAKFGSDISADLEYFLPRIDKIFLDKDGNFQVLKGSSSLSPIVPKNLDNAMHLYTLFLNAFTLNEKDLTIQKQDNRRYTMRDIGRLEKRLENVEYYTQLSLLETQAQSLQIQDAEGFDRFKNGFIVDNFTGHGVGDVNNLDYKVSMDMSKGNMRPLFNEESIQLIEADDDGTAILAADRVTANYQKTGDLITLPYTETTIIEQPYASQYINVNPFSIFTWLGSLNLNPPGDEWKETNRVPDLIINQQGSFDTMLARLGNPNLESISVNTVWNEWQDFWQGTPVETTTTGKVYRGRNRVAGRGRGAGGWTVNARDITTTTTQDIGQTRTGIRTAIVPQVVKTSLGDKILSVAFVPFIRSRTIEFSATRLKPNTKVYPFFDNISITANVAPVGGSLGNPLITDQNGAVSGTFTIPDPKVDSNPRWRTGQRVFRLTSSSTNATQDVETAAEFDYIAKGTLENVQNTIVSTREAVTVRQTVNDTRNITRTSTRTTQEVIAWIDPIAQTFLIDDTGGVFVTSIECYFQSKDANIPVTMQIREVVNGYPSRTIVPFGEIVLNPDQVSISEDATVPTKFTFPSPVYLQEKTEYSFCLLSNCDKYNAWIATLGNKQVGSNQLISANPYAGVFFKSQNGSTWTADQTTDIKFKINRAEFENVTGEVTFINDELPEKILPTNSIRTFADSNKIRVFHPNHGMHGDGTTAYLGNVVTISGVSGTQTELNNFLAADINGTYDNNTVPGTISNVTLDSYDIIVPVGTANATGDIGGSSITVTENKLFDVACFNLSTLTVSDTSVDFTLRTTSGRSIHGTESEFVLETESQSTNISVGDNIYFTSPRMIASGINEEERVLNSSLFLKAFLTTSNTKLSPVIDTSRISMVAVQNRLNNPTFDNSPKNTLNASDLTSSNNGEIYKILLVGTTDFTLIGASSNTVGTLFEKSGLLGAGTGTVEQSTFVGDTAPVGTSTAAVYCTRPITLENESTALDIRLTQNVFSSSSVRVFFRTTGSNETRNINDLSWTPFNTDGREDISVSPAEDDSVFKEYKYSASGLNTFTTFQIKIVMKGTNSSYPPVIRDLRGIALAA